MLLCVDVGNSRLKSALWDGADWLARVASEHADLAQWAGDLPQAIQSVVACNVAGPVFADQLIQLAEQRQWRLEWLTASALHGGVRNGYARPEQLGADRWAGLLGARSYQLAATARQPLLVVLAGTATTIDALSTDGEFRGGVILPGLTLMCRALARATAQLPIAQGRAANWPTDTDSAIVSGTLEATMGAIERLYRRLAASENTEPLCVLAGGAAPALATGLGLPCREMPDLIFDGLRCHAQTLGLA